MMAYNPICIAGPQMNKKIMRRLNATNDVAPLTAEQRAYLHHDGAIDGVARLREMDLMGIDQVLVIPTMVIMHLPFAKSEEGVDVFCQAYNDFLVDWCSVAPERLYGAALLPVQDPTRTAKEIFRAKALGHPVGLIRPIDAQAKYPNELRASMLAGGGDYDEVFRAFEESGMVLGMHTFPAPGVAHPLGEDFVCSPGELFTRAGTDSQTFSFIHEMQSWLAQVLLSGFLDRYDRLKMAIFESNAEWLPYALDTIDRLFKLYASERGSTKSDRLPSEAFAEQCVISFESDEIGVFRQWDRFEDIGIWASDAYHHDGADSWSGHAQHGQGRGPPARQGEAAGRQRHPVLRHRAQALRHRGGAPDRASRLVPPGPRAGGVRRDGRPPSRAHGRAPGAWHRPRKPDPGPAGAGWRGGSTAAPGRRATDGRRRRHRQPRL